MTSETVDDSLRAHDDGPTEEDEQIVLLVECDRPSAGGARYSLRDVDEVHFGRGARREASRTTKDGLVSLTIRLPASTMSTAHARLVRAHGHWVLEDQGSRNGSFVNGARTTSAAIGPDDVLELGRAVFLLRTMHLGEQPADLDIAESALPRGLRTLLPDLAEGFAALVRIATSRVPVLLLGETGTGKEVLARAVHALSGRSGPFVAVNCGALPAGLVEGLLFGHVRGAFSGAARDEIGFVRSADGGTLFLDEVGELPHAAQVALLRVLQEGEVVPLGGTRPAQVDTRIIGATNRAIADAESDFRVDLRARLAGFTFTIPPLRERRCDLGVILANVLHAHFGDGSERVTLTPDLVLSLLRYGWQANVRELEQYVSAAVVLASDGILRPKHFPASLPRSAPPPVMPSSPPEGAELTDEERRLRATLLAQMRAHNGNVSAVARALNKAPTQVFRWLKRFQIDPMTFRAR